MKPRISVITIAYNSAKTIDKTINSVLNQNYDDLEYIIIDGGSTDGTVDIIKEYGSHISYWVSEEDEGISDAFNKGIKVATGDLIGILNSDDQYLPGALKIVADNYEDGTDVYRGSILIHEEGKSDYTYEPSMRFGMLPLKVNVCHLPTFISQKAYAKYGNYDTNFKLAMDLDLLRRFYRKGAKFKKIDAVLGRFNVGGLSTEAGIQRGFDERKKVILNNGGNLFWILIYDVYLFCVHILKSGLNFFNLNYKEIRYK